MKIQRVVQPPKDVKSDWLILGLFEDDAGLPAGVEGTGVGATIERLRSAKEMTGTLADLTVLHEPSGMAAGAVLLVGLGPRGRFDAGAAFTAAVAASKRLAARARESVALVLPEAKDVTAVASAMVEGAVVGTRGPGLRLTEPSRHPFGSLLIVAPPGMEFDHDRIARRQPAPRRDRRPGGEPGARPGQYAPRREVTRQARRPHPARRRGRRARGRGLGCRAHRAESASGDCWGSPRARTSRRGSSCSSTPGAAARPRSPSSAKA